MELKDWLNSINQTKKNLIDEVENLGNFYVQSPYGKSLELNLKKISDIEAVTFSNNGYDTIIPKRILQNYSFKYPDEWVNIDSKPMIKKIKL